MLYSSEISYIEQAVSEGALVRTKNQYVVGVRIIKPDNSVKEVDMDEAVSVAEGKKEKGSYKKLAIPDLQVGDIQDYFIREEGRIDYLNISPQTFFLQANIRYYLTRFIVNKSVDNDFFSQSVILKKM
jgi:hypothetical protein